MPEQIELAAIVAEIDGVGVRVGDRWEFDEADGEVRDLLVQHWPAIRAALEERAKLEAALREYRGLLQTVVDKATPFGEIDEPGGPYIRSYLLPTGPIHRALAYLRAQPAAPAARAQARGEEG